MRILMEPLTLAIGVSFVSMGVGVLVDEAMRHFLTALGAILSPLFVAGLIVLWGERKEVYRALLDRVHPPRPVRRGCHCSGARCDARK